MQIGRFFVGHVFDPERVKRSRDFPERIERLDRSVDLALVVFPAFKKLHDSFGRFLDSQPKIKSIVLCKPLAFCVQLCASRFCSRRDAPSNQIFFCDFHSDPSLEIILQIVFLRVNLLFDATT